MPMFQYLHLEFPVTVKLSASQPISILEFVINHIFKKNNSSSNKIEEKEMWFWIRCNRYPELPKNASEEVLKEVV